jgi:hypothetical protein
MDSFTNNTGTQGGMTGGSGLTGGTQGGMTGNAGHNDVGDKVFDAVGKQSGHNINPSTSEKITDGARGLFEKATGLVHPLLDSHLMINN